MSVPLAVHRMAVLAAAVLAAAAEDLETTVYEIIITGEQQRRARG